MRTVQPRIIHDSTTNYLRTPLYLFFIVDAYHFFLFVIIQFLSLLNVRVFHNRFFLKWNKINEQWKNYLCIMQ